MKSKKNKTGIARLIQIAQSKKWWLIGSIIVAVCATLVQFVPFIAIFNIVGELADHATDTSAIDADKIWYWAKVSLIAVGAYGVFTFISLMFSHIAAFNILYELRMMLARKLARLPLGFFNKKSSGEIKKIMSEDVERIELFVAHHIPDFISAMVFPAVMIVWLFFIDWRLALLVSAVMALALLIQMAIYSKKSKKDMGEYMKSQADLNNSIVEYIRGMQVIKIFNRSASAYEKLKNDILYYRDTTIGITKNYAPNYLGFFNMISSVLVFLIPAAIYLLTKAPVYNEYVKTVLSFLILGGGIFFPMIKLMWMGNLMRQNSIGVGMIDEILNKDEITAPADSKPLPADTSVEFDNVSFAYDKNLVLRNISFYAVTGTVTALVGASGSGKSTIAMLTARFWDVTSGNIYIGGRDIKEIATNDLMDHVSFVFQDNMLFFDTIEENIRMGKKDASREEVIAAAKAAQCHEFIVELDKGYDTLVGEGGTYLSGGEAQRIALARAVLKDAPILLLDEATAYADPENEGKILKTFSELIKNKTVIVIAHRLSTIVSADRILVIDNGEVAEHGKHDELLALKGIYKNMWDAYSRSREWTLTR